MKPEAHGLEIGSAAVADAAVSPTISKCHDPIGSGKVKARLDCIDADELSPWRHDQNIVWWLAQLKVRELIIDLARNSKEIANTKGRKDWKSAHFRTLRGMWSKSVGGKVGRSHLKPVMHATLRWMEGV